MIAAGQSHSLFVDIDCGVWACGLNDNGQLGLEHSARVVKEPTQIQDLPPITYVAANQHSLFVDFEGTLWGCGNNLSNQMGPGKENIKKPRRIEDLPEISQVSASFYCSLLLATNGEVWGAGKNPYGQLGNGPKLSEAARIENVPKMKSTCAAFNHSLFLDSDGHVWVSGNNGNHRLGLGHTVNKSSPVKLENLPPIKSIAAGWVHSILLDEEDRVWIFGGNENSQLGVSQHTTITYKVPTLVEELRDIHSISANYYHSIFIGNEKSYVAGGNYNGVLACNNVGEYLPLKRAELLEKIPIIASVSTLYHSLFVDHSGSVWSCGKNSSNQLGVVTPPYTGTPVQIQSLPCIGRITNHTRVKSARNVGPV